MKTPDPMESIEQDVLSSAADDFMNEALGGRDRGTVIDAQPVAGAKKKVGKPRMIVLGGAALALIAVGAVALGGGDEGAPPADLPPTIAEVRDAPPIPGEQAQAPADSDAPPKAEDFAPAPAPQEVVAAVPAATPPVPVDSASVAPPAPAAAPAVEPAAEAPVVARGTQTPAPVESSEVQTLKARIAELERNAQAKPAVVASPTRIQVAEVLSDGVVLKDQAGKTVIVPAGTTVVARGGSLDESRR